jgi:glycine/D-amino acid oxidase-like deaminating enzyme
VSEVADVLIVGGGIVGCATAYFLAREGIATRVLEQPEPAAEVSGANADLIARGRSSLPLEAFTLERFDVSRARGEG